MAALDTATSATTANPSGTFTTTYTQQPTRVKRGKRWVGLDPTLVKRSGHLEPRVAALPLAVSAGGSGPVVSLGSGSDAVGLGFAGQSLPAPVVSGSTATYSLSSTSKLLVTTSASAFSADVVLSAAPTTAPTYRFSLTSALSASQPDSGGVILTDSAGTVQDLVRPPTMWDAQTDSAGDPSDVAPVSQSLSTSPNGAELDLSPSMSYLTDPHTQYPVTIDPTVTVPGHGSSEVTGVPGGSGNTTSYNDAYPLYVGSRDGTNVYRSFVSFQPDRFDGAQITNASLNLYEYASSTCAAQPTSVQPLSGGFHQDPNGSTPATVWSTQPGVVSGSDWATSQSFNTGHGGCSPVEPDGFEPIDVTKLVAGNTSGDLTAYGWRLSAPTSGSSETNTNYWKDFCSEYTATQPGTDNCTSTSDAPYLSITYTSDLGLQSSFPLTSHKLNDRSTLYVNNGNGNAVLAANDLRISGVGQSLTVGRYYNSLSTSTSGVFGPGWTMSVGPDVRLIKRGSGTPGSWFDYEAPSGTVYGTFVQNGSGNSYRKPSNGGVHAELSYDTASGDYKLEFDKSRLTYWFDGCSTCDQLLVRQSDRHGNAITYTYNAGNELTKITDTEGRDLTLSYNGDGTLASMSDASGRTWGYGYTSGYLTSYTDPRSKTTNYGYTSGQLTTITDPAGSDANADRPTTTVTYSGGQVTEADYSRDSSTGGSYDFTYAYGLYGNSTLSGRCNSNDADAFSTDVTDVDDAQGGTTTYCFRYPYLDQAYNYTGLQEQVYDGDGHKRSGKYTADHGVSTTADGNANASGSGASTVFNYDSSQTENLTSAVAPADSGNTGGTTNLSYDDTENNPNLPTSDQNSDGQCTKYSYSSGGDLTDSYSGLSGGSGNDCSSASGGSHNHIDYNSDGTVQDTYNPDGSTSTETTYGYFSGSNDGGHSYLDGQLAYIVQPGGTAPSGTACSSSTPLCTSYTYDQLDRVVTVTRGTGDYVRQHYDADDRIVELDVDSTSCYGSHANCDTYSYDGEGNLTSVTDRSNRTRTFGYDRLNRQVSETVPGSTSTIHDAYDGAGDLTSYTDGADSTVTYGYDAADELTSIHDATGTFTILNDNDGNRLRITEPNGVSISTTYHANNQVATIHTGGGSGLPAQYSYSYVAGSGSQEGDQLQKLTIGSNSTYYGYNAGGQLCWVGTAAFSSCGSTTNRSYYYAYDADGDIINATNGSGTTHYGYADTGALCWSGTASGTYVAGSCPSTPSGATTYTGDNAGNLTGTTTNPGTLSYNASNQATSLAPLSGSGTSNSVSYIDQGNGLRAAVGSDSFDNGPLGVTALTNSGGTTYYTRDPQGNLIDEHGASGTYDYLTDRNNSVIALINVSGADAGDYHYDPYGALTNAGSLTSAASANPWRYDSGYQDTEGDNDYHFGARYYDPTIRTFTQSDTVIGNAANPHSVDLYAYAGGDPINATDPTGHSIFGDVLKGAGIAVGIGAAVFATGGVALGLGVLAGGLDAAGGIANGDSPGEIATSAGLDAVSGGVGPAGELVGIAGSGEQALSGTYAAANSVYGLGSTYAG